MCYSEFGEIIEHIARLDADVLSIEASRSGMELLDAFREFEYPGEIGPGRLRHPLAARAVGRGARAAARARRGSASAGERLWVNPDCGLKTRAWPEARASLANMVEAARRRRAATG